MKKNILVGLLIFVLIGNIILFLGIYGMFNSSGYNTSLEFEEYMNIRKENTSYFLTGAGIILLCFISAFFVIPSKI